MPTAAKSAKDELLHTLRVIVFREGDIYVAQGIELDISTQAKDIDTLIKRLDLTIDAECAMSLERGGKRFEGVPSAPNYYHDLWEKRSVALTHLHVPVDHHLRLEVALAQAA